MKGLRERFEIGERLTVVQIIEEYFAPAAPLSYLLAKDRARSWVTLITQGFNKEGKMFGRLSDEGAYGFPTNNEEAKFIGTKGYVLTKGHINSVVRKIQNGQRQKLLQVENENIILPHPVAGLLKTT